MTAADTYRRYAVAASRRLASQPKCKTTISRWRSITSRWLRLKNTRRYLRLNSDCDAPEQAWAAKVKVLQVATLLTVGTPILAEAWTIRRPVAAGRPGATYHSCPALLVRPYSPSRLGSASPGVGGGSDTFLFHTVIRAVSA
jgi:hypothetical protein